MAFDKPITIQQIDEATEKWVDAYRLHAEINKSSSDSEYLGSGSSQSKRQLTFKIRYIKPIEEIDTNRHYYRIMYNNKPYSIEDIDDFMMKHQTVKILGVSY